MSRPADAPALEDMDTAVGAGYKLALKPPLPTRTRGRLRFAHSSSAGLPQHRRDQIGDQEAQREKHDPADHGLVARDKSRAALKAGLFHRIFVGIPRRFSNRLRKSRLDSAENSPFSRAPRLSHGLLGVFEAFRNLGSELVDFRIVGLQSLELPHRLAGGGKISEIEGQDKNLVIA